jgi:hypothetical protein
LLEKHPVRRVGGAEGAAEIVVRNVAALRCAFSISNQQDRRRRVVALSLYLRVKAQAEGCSSFAGSREQVSCVVIRARKGLESIEAQGFTLGTTLFRMRREGAPARMS